MDTFGNEAEGATTINDSSLTHVHTMQSDLSEPEDSASSASEYFSDDDMYPAFYDDEPVSNGSDSGSEPPSSASQSV
jgi:hypothetical protein